MDVYGRALRHVLQARTQRAAIVAVLLVAAVLVAVVGALRGTWLRPLVWITAVAAAPLAALPVLVTFQRSVQRTWPRPHPVEPAHPLARVHPPLAHAHPSLTHTHPLP